MYSRKKLAKQELAKRNQELNDIERIALLDLFPPASETETDAQKSGSEKGISDYLRAIRKYLWAIISITLISTILAAVYMARQPDVYSAASRIQVDYESNPALSSAQNTAVIVSSPVSDPYYINTQLQILTSGGFLRRVVKTLDLENNPDFFRSPKTQNHSTWENLKRMVGIGKEEKTKIPQTKPGSDDLLIKGQVAPATSPNDLEEAQRLAPYVGAIQARLEVTQIRNTRLILIQYTHTDQQVAAKVVNAIADTFVYTNLEKMVQINSSAGNFLQKRVAELQSLIRRDEERLINYAKNHMIVSLDGNENTVAERLTSLNRQVLEAENERNLAEATYRSALKPETADALANGNGLSQAEIRLNELRQQRAQLSIDFTDESPEIKVIDEQITVLQKQIGESRTRAKSVLLTTLEARYRQALAREQSLREAFNKQRDETLTQNEAAINYRIIQQEIATNKTLLDGLMQRYKENDMILNGTPNNLSIAEYAIAQGSLKGPKRMQGVGIAFIVSLAFGLGLAIILGYLDDTIRSPIQAENVTGLPTLAVVPKIKRANRFLPSGTKHSHSLLNGATISDDNKHLLLNGSSNSPLAEVYRKLRTSLIVSANGNSLQTILVTSSLPREGKTTTALNTALVMAQTGDKVLIIDADLRKPSLHEIFGIENYNGLSSLLFSRMDSKEIDSAITQYGESSFYIMTAGLDKTNPGELLNSDKMRQLINALKTKFKYIVLDSPPLVPFTDSVLLSMVSDGVLLVINGGKSSQEVVKASHKVLKGAGAKIFGVVLNKSDANLRKDYYHYYPAS